MKVLVYAQSDESLAIMNIVSRYLVKQSVSLYRIAVYVSVEFINNGNRQLKS